MRNGRRRGFWARWGLPLLGGPLVTVGAVAAIAISADRATRPVEVPAVTASIDSSGEEMPEFLRRAAAPPQAAAPEVEPPPASLRNVTPLGVTPGPAPEGPLVRIPVAAVATPVELRPDDVYRRVMVLDAASFRAVRDKTPIIVRIAGVTAPSFKDTCTDPAGKVWKCGAKARAELARLIGGKAVSCLDVDETDPVAPLARCTVGRFDLARWLVENGWADPGDGADAEMQGLADKAKADQRGRFGSAPSGIIAG